MLATEIAEKYVELTHGRTRYFEAGTGYPTILIHGVGFATGGDGWLQNIGPLSEKLRVLAPDCPGWGPGDAPDMDFHFAYLTDFIREFQDALGLEKTNIVGHSMGGWLASLFAYESPDRVNKLVLVAAGGTATRTIPSMTEFQPPNREAILKQLEERFSGLGLNLEKMADEKAAVTSDPAHLEPYRRILKNMNQAVVRQQYGTLRRLPHIKVPTLVLWGREDKTNSIEMGENTAKLVPNSKLVIFENCGHFVPTEKVADFNREVLNFLGE